VRLLAPLAVIAALAGTARADPDDDTEVGQARLAAAIRARDARAIARQLHPRLDLAGVWFADPACAKRFASHTALAAGDLDAFARCLAQLRLQVTTRHTSTPGGAVLTYEPGIELELVFDGPLVRWIGFEAQGWKDANLPTLSAQAFEALRRSGTTNLDATAGKQLATAAASRGSVAAWIKLCLDPTGAITTAELRDSTTPAAGAILLAAIKDWSFRGFEHKGKKLPVCALSYLIYPAAKAPSYETLPTAAPASIGDDSDEVPTLKPDPSAPKPRP
jgi:hypothetical protein